MKIFRLFLVLVIAASVITSCTVQSRSMKSPNNHVQFVKDDFDFSKQVTGEATSTKIFGIDFARLFNKKYGEVIEANQLSIPIIGSFVANWVNMYALYNAMQDNPGYDVVFYPQFETKTTGFGFIFSTTTVKVTARLAKIK